jgi:hypothetical protein
MNYSKIYKNLIESAQTRFGPISSYTEVHHIVPRCMGGNNDDSNLVVLTPEEHHVAHLLLMKMYPDNEKLVYAAFMMTVGKHRNNKLYGWLKRKRFEKPMPDATRLKIKEKRSLQVMSPRSEETKQKMRGPNPKKGRKGALNGFYGKKHTEDTLKILREKCPRLKGYKQSPETIKKFKESWTDEKRLQYSLRLTERNKNPTEEHRQATRNSNIRRGIEKQKTKIRTNLPLYTYIFESLKAGKEVKLIAKEINADYHLVWSIKTKWDYYMTAFKEVCDEQ